MDRVIQRELQEINPYVRMCVHTKTHVGWALINRIIYDHQLALIVAGLGVVIIDGKSYKVSKGDLFLIKPGVIHSFIADNELPYEKFDVHFDFFYERDRNFWPHKKFQLNDGNVALPDSHLMRDVPMFGKNMIFPDYLHIQNYTSIEVLMKKLIDLQIAIQPGKELIAKSYLLEILHVLYTEICVRKSIKNLNTDFEKIKNAFEYMNENYWMKAKVEDLANLCNLSPNYFSTLFKQQTGYSPYEYLIHIRIEKAKMLLAKNTLSISEISEKVGFGDMHYFSLYFKKIEGLPPSLYRLTVSE